MGNTIAWGEGVWKRSMVGEVDGDNGACMNAMDGMEEFGLGMGGG